MAAGGRLPLFSFLFPFSKSRLVQTLKQRCSLVAKVREASTQPHTEAGRLKLQQESDTDAKDHVARYYYNRNPRSPELLGLADKPRGFKTWHRRVDFYHRLMVDVTGRHISAYVDHNNGTKVVHASTKEFCLARQLYKTSDTSAAFNLGRVIASRCKEAGLRRVMWEHKWNRNHLKVIAFIRGVRLEGLILNEPKKRRRPPQPGSLPGH